jgi:hypothetical protein
VIGRETIYTAAYAKTASVAGIVTRSRRLRHWTEVDPTQQPALYFAQNDQAAAVGPAGPGGATVTPPTRWALTADLYLYVHETTCAAVLGLDPNDDAVLAKAFNLLLDRLDAAYAPGVGQMEQTLSTVGNPPLVARCRIAGPVTTDGGLLGPQAVAVIPLEIICL